MGISNEPETIDAGLLRTILDNFPESYLSIIEKDLSVGYSTGLEFKKQNLDPAQFIGLELEEVFGEEAPVVKTHYLKTFAGEEREFELFINGQHQLYRTVPLREEDGSINRILSVVTNITDRRLAEDSLRESEQRLRSIGDNLPAGLIFQLMVRPDGTRRFTYFSSAIERLHECTVEQALADPGLLFGRVVEDDLAGLISATEESIDKMSIFDHEVRIRRKSGDLRYHRMVSRPRRLDDGTVLFDGIDLDVTEYRQVQTALQRRSLDLGERVKELNCLYGISELLGRPDVSIEDVFQGAVDLIPPSWQYPDDTCARVLYENKEFRTDRFRKTRWKQTSDILVHGHKAGSVEVYYLVEKPQSYDGPFLKEERSLISAIAGKLGRSIEYRQAQEELKLKNAQLEQLATHDILTGLPNRMVINDRINQSLSLSRRNNTKTAVCMADVDDFKHINDSFGHSGGDKVLKEIAARAKSELRAHDTISRHGGDEFVILLQDIKTRSQVTSVVERIMRTVGHKISFENNSIEPSLSIGIALFPADGTTTKELIRKADDAMYKSKKLGKNRYCFLSKG